MVEAFVLVQVDMGAGRRVTEEVADVAGVRLAQFVTGPYDVIARIQAPDVGPLNRTIEETQRVPGVSRTPPCTIIRL